MPTATTATSTPAATALLERVSYASATATREAKPENAAYEDYQKHAALPTPELEGGALRPGGPPRLLSRECMGLLAQYAAIGLVYGSLAGAIYPFLTVYLNMEGQAVASASALLEIPWTLKILAGMVTDTVPIGGYRRRPYMVLGWGVATLCIFTMAFLPMPEPYFVDPNQRFIPPSEFEVYDVQVRPGAPHAGGKYIVLMMVVSLGYVIADSAADGVVVEFAQREPVAIRGRTQTATYAIRALFQVVSFAFLGFGLNSREYGGTYDQGLTFASVMVILGVCCLPVTVLTWFGIYEEPHPGGGMGRYLQQLWEALQTRAFYQIIAYNFFSGVLANISYIAVGPMQIFWVRATNLSEKLAGILGSLVLVLALAITGKIGLHWNWRVVIATAAIVTMAIDAVASLLTTWDVVRSPWFWFGVPMLGTIPAGMSSIISTYVVVELAGSGNESVCYGLLTTVAALSLPLATSISKNVNGAFDVWNADIMADTTHVRWHVTWTILITYAAKLLSLGLLGLLPRQKAETQLLKRTGGSSRLMGIVTIAYCLLALVWSVLTNIFSIFESTQCLKITGGCRQ